jgi:hypothetical protein
VVAAAVSHSGALCNEEGEETAPFAMVVAAAVVATRI